MLWKFIEHAQTSYQCRFCFFDISDADRIFIELSILADRNPQLPTRTGTCPRPSTLLDGRPHSKS